MSDNSAMNAILRGEQPPEPRQQGSPEGRKEHLIKCLKQGIITNEERGELATLMGSADAGERGSAPDSAFDMTGTLRDAWSNRRLGEGRE
jgi:hypothetical protein